MNKRSQDSWLMLGALVLSMVVAVLIAWLAGKV